MKSSLSLPEYEILVYTLQQQFASIIRSTLLVARRSRYLAESKGSLFFAAGYRLNIYESLSLDDGPLQIEDYSYEVWRGDEKAVLVRFASASQRSDVSKQRSPSQTRSAGYQTSSCACARLEFFST